MTVSPLISVDPARYEEARIPSGVREFLRRNEQADLLRFSTAGSVDDGKSTLIGRLLSDCKSIYEDHLAALERDSKRLNREEVDLALLTDGLKAEREQAITIDVAYRYFSTPRRRFIIADTPGHEQYTRNMATGASTADLAVILVDAQAGILTQSRRHAFIASLLGVPHVVVAINKMDRVGYSESVFENIRSDFAEFTRRLEIRDMVFIPISALRGDNVVEASSRMPWYRGTTLLEHLERVHIGSDRNLIDLRFPVQYVNRPHQDFRGFCGTVASGVMRPGDEIVVLPSGRRSRIDSIEEWNGPMDHAFPPQAVTVRLRDEVDVSRGCMLVHPANLPYVDRCAEAMLVWMSENPLRLNRPYYIKQTTATVRGVVSSLAYLVDPNELHRRPASELTLNEIGRVQLEFFQPLCFDEYRRNRATGAFVMIDPSDHSTVGAGMIIERMGHRRAALALSARDALRRDVSTETSLVSAADRTRLLGQKPATLWFTGLSGSGKSTIARALEHALVLQGHAGFVLDGDNVRQGLNRDLGFSADDRSENIRRVAEVARLMNDAGLLVIVSFISPFRADRAAARNIVGPARFLEVYLSAPIEVCEQRDPKGLYRRARAGQIESFTGISAPYEPPDAPALILPSHEIDVDEAVRRLLDCLTQGGFFV